MVEDGPLTDELYEVIDEFRESQSTLKIVSLEQNQGLGNALNEGMKHCSFEIIARMDTDDICYPDRFEKQISYMECHFDVDVVGCWTQEFYEDLEGHKVITSLKKFPNTVWHNIKYCTKRCPVEHPAVVLRKKAVLAVGGYQHCYLFEDYHCGQGCLLMDLNFTIFKNRYCFLEYLMSHLRGVVVIDMQ